jgi:hypothetical protein
VPEEVAAMTTVATRSRSRVEQATGGAPLPLSFSLVLGGIVAAAGLFGLLVGGAYRISPGVRPDLAETLRGQDIVNLLTVPVLIWCAVKARAGSFRAHVLWLAVCLYLAYTYLMYVVAPFNDIFLLYVAGIGLAGFGLLNGLVRIRAGAVAGAFEAVPRRPIAWFLIVAGSLFALVWLAQVVAAIPGGVPEGLFTYDIPNMVHVLDLSLALPLVIGSGVLLLRRHPMAPVLAALMLCKIVTLGLALISMNAYVLFAGGSASLGETVVWAVMALVAAGALALGARRTGPVAGDWLRPTFWA